MLFETTTVSAVTATSRPSLVGMIVALVPFALDPWAAFAVAVVAGGDDPATRPTRRIGVGVRAESREASTGRYDAGKVRVLVGRRRRE